MDNWWLIYNEADVERNRAYIDMYFASCGKRGIDLRLITVNSVPSDPEKLCSGQPLPSKAINRSRDWQLSAYLEEKGVRVYNDSHTAELGNDKLKAVRFAEKLGIPVPVTVENEGDIDTWPKVMKSRGGHGGTEVFLLHDRHEYEVLKDTKTADGSSFIFQKPVSDMGKDLRIYITGGEITAAMMRQSYNDFRSNYCLGGTASVHELTDEERQIAEKICSELHPAHIGIDLIYDGGKPVFNEIEDAVGSRMLYRYTDIDVVELYVAHVLGGARRDAGKD